MKRKRNYPGSPKFPDQRTATNTDTWWEPSGDDINICRNCYCKKKEHKKRTIATVTGPSYFRYYCPTTKDLHEASCSMNHEGDMCTCKRQKKLLGLVDTTNVRTALGKKEMKMLRTSAKKSKSKKQKTLVHPHTKDVKELLPELLSGLGYNGPHISSSNAPDYRPLAHFNDYDKVLKLSHALFDGGIASYVKESKDVRNKSHKTWYVYIHKLQFIAASTIRKDITKGNMPKNTLFRDVSAKTYQDAAQMLTESYAVWRGVYDDRQLLMKMVCDLLYDARGY